MKNARGSKSAPTPKAPKTPAEGGPPEVALENGTVAVLPSPADAPAPAKARGRKKPQPTVAANPEVPEWAKRAAARDTTAEMATVPDAAPVPTGTTTSAVAAPTAKPGRTPKAKKTKAAPATTQAAAPGSLRAIGSAWIESLRAAGHTKSTLSSYAKDLDLAHEFLGADNAASGITEKQIAAFSASKGVLRKKNGKAKAKPTILKTRRALRLALTWAEQKGLIKKAPYSAKTTA